MCGITGVYHYGTNRPSHVDADAALAMTDRLVHRGPDGGGLMIDDHYGIALGHRRLSILDLSERGAQPMPSGDREVWITYNGEIYNYREIRTSLEQLGHAFRSDTDTEVVLAAYQQWGAASVDRFNGMFAFALWDQPRQRLWLVRDPVGIKPLFYHDDGRTLLFASEIKAILAHKSVTRQPDLRALNAFCTFAYTPAPQTGFDNIHQLLPGHSLTIERGRVRVVRYYDWPYPDAPPTRNEVDCVEQLADAVDESVGRQMVSDVPVGAFLSGGVDSSAVVAAMRSYTPHRVRAVCVGFDDSHFDESKHAAEVARRLNVDLHIEKMAPRFEQLLLQAMSHAEEPLADNSMLAVFLLCQVTRPNVKVALSGDGADELLAGYATYRASRYATMYRRVPKFLRRGLIQPLASLLPNSGKKYALGDLARRFVAGAEEEPLRDHCSWRRMLSSDAKAALYSEEMKGAACNADAIAQYAAACIDAPDFLTPLERQLHVDTAFHLPNDMLTKVDRMSMAHSLEVRVPLLDQQVIETCLQIPPQFKLRGRCGKYVLKQVLSRHLPPSIVHRKKEGFLLPMQRWLAAGDNDLLERYILDSALANSGMFDRSALFELVRGSRHDRIRNAYPLFTLLVLSVWWSMWIEQELSCQPVVPVNAAATRVWHVSRSEAA